MRTKEITADEKYHLFTGRIFLFISRVLTQNFKAANLALTKEQWTIMSVLWRMGAVSQQKIADETGRDKPSTTRLIDTLEKEGYLSRKPDKQDRRINMIHLTEKGKRIEAKATRIVEETFNTLAHNITTDEILTIRNVFNKIYKHSKPSAS